MRALVIRSRAALTGSAYLSMFFLGVGNAVIGAASGTIGLAPYQIGLFIAAQNLGFFITVITAGALSDSIEKPRLLFPEASSPRCHSSCSISGGPFS